ncbi:hypothetical protein ABC347_04435 [Sphingomonas sp. 1P06PA]|uniref:hypothetical protein n=1 Tax=Sphingomonas sp. 1P06PA TaxID=554121 RepID=UPI0039A43278
MKTLFATIAMLAASAAQAAPPCVPRDQAEAMIGAVAPAIVEGLTTRCRPVLPAQSYLGSSGGALASRFRSEIRPDWRKARAAIDQVGGERLPEMLSDETLSAIVDPIVRDLIAAEVPTEDCATADRLIGLIAPLPAGNIVGLVVALMEVADKRGGKFAICKPS